MAYTFEQIFAADPANPSNIAQNAAITIFAPGDVTMTPLTITDPDGQPLANPIPVNANGFGSAFAHATLDRVAWAGGGFTGFFTSYEGMKQVAVDAQTAAEAAAATAGADAAAVATAAIGDATADANAAAASAATAATNASASATAAANSAALVGAPADTAVETLINSASATKAALNATYVPKWKATTAYLAGDKVLNPGGDVVSAIANFTSGASYNAANWASVAFPLAKGVPQDTDPASVPVLRTQTDGKVARWEYIHNGGSGYLWHLLAGANSTSGAWMFGVGLDAGSGGGAIFRNKSAGIAFKLEQLNSITSTTAYGLAIEQRSQAPAIFGEMFTEATAALSSLVSYKSDSATLPLAMWQGANAKGGRVLAATGVLEWDTDVSVRNAPLRLKGDPTAPQDNQIMGRNGSLQFASYTGSTDQYWHKRIRHGGQSLFLELSGTTSGGPDGTVSTWYKAVEALQSGAETRLGFFGVTPVAKPAAITAPTGGATIDAEARAAINSIRTALTALGITA